MKKLFLILGIVLSFNFLFSQNPNPNLIFVEKLQPGATVLPDTASGMEVEGTPYLDSTFFNGEFQIQRTRYLSSMRYNIFLGAFEVKQGDIIVYINSYAVDTVFCNNSKFIYKKDGEKLNVYEALSKKANFDLLKQHKVTYNEGNIGKSKKNKYPSFKSAKPVYYIFSAGKGMSELKGINGFQEIFPEKKEEIKAFCKENKLKKNTESSLITLFNYVALLK
jgi:hypothetical protein